MPHGEHDRPPLDNASRQQPVRRVLRVKTVEALPRPMTAEVYAALLGELRTRRDRALLEVMWEGDPARRGARPAAGGHLLRAAAGRRLQAR